MNLESRGQMRRRIDEYYEDKLTDILVQTVNLKGTLSLLQEMEEFITSIAFDRRLPEDIRKKAEEIVYVSD